MSSVPDPFTLETGLLEDEHLRIERVEGRERLSDTYDFALDVQSTIPTGRVERSLLGQTARLSIRYGERIARFTGIIASVRTQPSDRGDVRLHRSRLRLVPRAWLMRQRVNTRIFRDVPIERVLREVCESHGVHTRFELLHRRAARPYITQYEESDYAFVRRLCGENGLSFRFDQRGGDIPRDALATFRARAREAITGAAALMGASAVGSELADRALGAAREILHDLEALLPSEVMVFSDDAMWAPPLDAEDDVPQPTELFELARRAASLSSPQDVARELGAAFAAISTTMSARAPVLRYNPEAGALQSDPNEAIARLTLRSALRPETATYRDFDPLRPGSPIQGRASSRSRWDLLTSLASQIGEHVADAIGAMDQSLGEAADTMHAFGRTALAIAADSLPTNDGERTLADGGEREVYDHQGRMLFPEWQDGTAEAVHVLRSARRDALVGRGRSACIRLRAGRRFVLEEHPEHGLNRGWVVTEVRHRGHNVGLRDGATRRVYENTFRSVPAEVHYVPPRPPRRTIQALLTATVVGTASEEIHAAAMAEIRVRFHWDRSGANTCWLRTMQPWAGAGWGFQFLPRAGAEVVVGFEGGDPDKPIVLGSVYNAVNPTPFPIPQSATRSGIRTRTTPQGDDGNELSFEDAREREQILLRAKRNLDVDVTNDCSTLIGRNDRVVVQGDRDVRIVGDLHNDLQNERTEIKGSYLRHVEGPSATIAQTTSDRVERDARRQVGGRQSVQVAGTDELRTRHRLRRVRGSSVEIVGGGDGAGSRQVLVDGNHQSTTGGRHEIVAAGEIVLRCGDSALRIGPELIEITAKKLAFNTPDATLHVGDGRVRASAANLFQAVSEGVLLRSSGASLALSTVAHLDGAQVKLKSPNSAQDPIREHRIPRTIIELVDDNGRPIPNQRYRIALSSGGELSGALDDNGRAELEIEGGGSVTFPDLSDTQMA